MMADGQHRQRIRRSVQPVCSALSCMPLLSAPALPPTAEQPCVKENARQGAEPKENKLSPVAVSLLRLIGAQDDKTWPRDRQRQNAQAGNDTGAEQQRSSDDCDYRYRNCKPCEALYSHGQHDSAERNKITERRRESTPAANPACEKCNSSTRNSWRRRGCAELLDGILGIVALTVSLNGPFVARILRIAVWCPLFGVAVCPKGGNENHKQYETAYD